MRISKGPAGVITRTGLLTKPRATAAATAPVEPVPELIAFGSHVDEARLAAARDAGYDRVLPNSRLNRELPDLVR